MNMNIFNIYNYMYILRHNVNYYLNYLCMNEQLKKSPFWPGRRDQHEEDGHRPLIACRRRGRDAQGAT